MYRIGGWIMVGWMDGVLPPAALLFWRGASSRPARRCLSACVLTRSQRMAACVWAAAASALTEGKLRVNRAAEREETSGGEEGQENFYRQEEIVVTRFSGGFLFCTGTKGGILDHACWSETGLCCCACRSLSSLSSLFLFSLSDSSCLPLPSLPQSIHYLFGFSSIIIIYFIHHVFWLWLHTGWEQSRDPQIYRSDVCVWGCVCAHGCLVCVCMRKCKSAGCCMTSDTESSMYLQPLTAYYMLYIVRSWSWIYVQGGCGGMPVTYECPDTFMGSDVSVPRIEWLLGWQDEQWSIGSLSLIIAF